MATDQSVPARPWARPPRPARRGRRPQLDRDRIVAEALSLVDRDGLAAFSLRRLADALDVTPMAIYWHVADRAELLELVGHAVLDEVRVPPPAGDWRRQLRDLHRALLDVVLRHPETTEILIGRARYGASGLRLFERILGVLLGAGLEPAAAFDAYQSLYLFTLGFTATASRNEAFVRAQREGIAYMLQLPEDAFPAIRAVAPTIGRRSLDEQFAIGLDVVIEGIAATLVTP